MRVEGRVDKANGTLAGLAALNVDASEETGDEGSGHGSTTSKNLSALDDEGTVVTCGGHVGVATASAVVNTTSSGDLAILGLVGLVARVVLREVSVQVEGVS